MRLSPTAPTIRGEGRESCTMASHWPPEASAGESVTLEQTCSERTLSDVSVRSVSAGLANLRLPLTFVSILLISNFYAVHDVIIFNDLEQTSRALLLEIIAGTELFHEIA